MNLYSSSNKVSCIGITKLKHYIAAPNLAQQNHQVYQNIDLIPNQNMNRGANLNAAVPGFGQMNAPVTSTFEIVVL